MCAYAGAPALLAPGPPPAVCAYASLRRLCTRLFRLSVGVRSVGLPLPFRCQFRFIVVRLVDRAFSRVRAVAVTLLCVKLSSVFGASAAIGSPWLNNTWCFDWVRRTFRQGRSELWRWFGTTRSLAEERTPHQLLLRLVAVPSKSNDDQKNLGTSWSVTLRARFQFGTRGAEEHPNRQAALHIDRRHCRCFF